MTNNTSASTSTMSKISRHYIKLQSS